MTIKVKTEFVSDRLIYTNMKKETAEKNKDVFAAFNFADTDGDKKISEKEYNEYLKNSCSIDLKAMDVTAYRHCPTRYTKTLLENTQVDFYPGLELGDIPRDARSTYTMIDTDGNNTLSKEELQKFNEARDLVEKTKQEIKDKSKKHGPKMGGTGFAGLAGTLSGTYMAVFTSIGPVGWAVAGVSVLGTVGYLLYEGYSYKKECKGIEQKLLEQTNNHPYVLEHLRDFNFYYD